MKVLVIGSGGREHALCWKLAQSKRLTELYCAPGNAGISELAERVDIKAGDIDSLSEFVVKNKIDLTVVGPEQPLVDGIVDNFNKKGLKIFGPDTKAARLEASKVFAKELMAKFKLPTAGFEVFNRPDKAKSFVKTKEFPVVIKADGLCAGKGVIIADTEEEASSAIDSFMKDKKFAAAGERIVIEDCLKGEEASIMLVTDGKDFILMPTSQDHKRALDNDKGPNTGGMGAYSPAPVIDKAQEGKIVSTIIKPLMRGLSKEGISYKGVLYIGLMIADNNPYILEFNVRFGDPEAQVILPRLKSDILDIIEASVEERIKDLRPEIDTRACVCVVCASDGYPGSYKKGLPINGLDKASGMDDIIVFHAGTKSAGHSQYETNGGRVLGIASLGTDIKNAIDKAYEGVSVVNFEGIQYRKDIGHKALERV